MRLQLILRALKSRNLRLLFAGQGISLIGTWLQQAAMSWLVYRMTGSAVLLGVVSFASQIPSLFLSPIAGVLADRCKNLRGMLLCTQTLSLLQAAVLALCVVTGQVRVWHLVSLSFFLGILNAFDTSSRQSFFVELVECREDLGNAIALNSSLINAARLLGPSLAGIIIAAAGEGVCFVLNALSYLAVIAGLAGVRVQERVRVHTGRRVMSELREGFSYAFGSPPIRRVLLLTALSSIAGMPFTVLLPVFARETFKGGAGVYGLLMAAVGSGALAGTLYLASRSSVIGLSRVIPLTMVAFGSSLVAFAISRSLPLSLIFLAIAGFGGMTLGSSSNATIQSLVDEDKRGRVLSIFIMAVVGLAPIGSMLAGIMAQHLGAPHTLALGGFLCLVGGLVFARHLPSFQGAVRQVYQRNGMIL